MLTIYHNSGCSKSNAVLELMQERGVLFDVRLYLSAPLNADELKALLQKLQLPAKDLVRKSEPVFIASYQDKELTEEEWIQAMATHPVLMERPVVEKDGRAIIARPPDKVLELL